MKQNYPTAVNVNLELLKDYNLTPNEYVTASIIYKKDWDVLKDLSKILNIEDSLSNLDSKGLIGIPKEYDGTNFESIKIRNKLLFILGEVDYFDELVEKYPVKVVRSDGIKDYLRTDLRRCRTNYNKIATTRKRHERILKALEYEKEVRDKENSWKFMRRLPKWLSTEEWKVFEERMKDEGEGKNKEKLGYGQQLK